MPQIQTLSQTPFWNLHCSTTSIFIAEGFFLHINEHTGIFKSHVESNEPVNERNYQSPKTEASSVV